MSTRRAYQMTRWEDWDREHGTLPSPATAYFPWPNTDWLTKINWIVLAASRDGHTWYYLGDRQPFIPNGEGDSWDAHYIRMANLSTTGGPLVKDDELWFYYLGIYGGTTDFPGKERSDKGRWQSAGGVGTIRRDGFASLNAAEEPGQVFTRPLVDRLNYRPLQLNCHTRAAVSPRICSFSSSPRKSSPSRTRRNSSASVGPSAWSTTADIRSTSGLSGASSTSRSDPTDATETSI